MQFQRYYGFSLKYDIVMGDNMSRQMIEFFTAWGFPIFSWAVALFFWILTYVILEPVHIKLLQFDNKYVIINA